MRTGTGNVRFRIWEDEQMTKETEQLLQLIKENPELPVVPMVDGEVVGDDSYRNSAW